jgi:Mg-chelatase subunit ChlI
VGSGNPEEGDLRPQLLDRFGLSVEVRSPRDVATRVEVVLRREAYEADPFAFAATWGQAEADLREDALMNYAEVLRNQGRLVKSADTFLAVANLDNGKNRAEAAYKAGVVYFRAGLLEKATSSWNIAANDLENSKFSALATERLNRIR